MPTELPESTRKQVEAKMDIAHACIEALKAQIATQQADLDRLLNLHRRLPKD